MENLTESIPTQDSLALEKGVSDKVCLVPGDYFFIECIEVANEITDTEKSDFLMLQIEGLSPFPLDQILWGYFALEGSDHYLIYAALKDRLALEKIDELEHFTWVIPSFIPHLLLGKSKEEPASMVQSLSQVDKAHSYEMHLAKDQALVFCENQSKADSQPESEVESDAPEPFEPLDPLEQVEPATVSLSTNQLWAADIRPGDFKSKEQKNRSRLGIVNRSIKYSLFFLCLILVSEIGLVLANTWLASYTSKIDQQSAMVRVIEDQHSLINKLEQISQNELRPVAALERANEVRSQTNSKIIYDAVEINGANSVTIKGTAGSVNQFNIYVTKLTQSGYFKISEDPKYITRGGKTTFTLKMDYQHSDKTL